LRQQPLVAGRAAGQRVYVQMLPRANNVPKQSPTWQTLIFFVFLTVERRWTATSADAESAAPRTARMSATRGQNSPTRRRS
jgi:hypothetical protein